VRAAAGDDMVVRDDVTGGVEDDAGAESLRVLDLDDRRRKLVHDGRDRPLERERGGCGLEPRLARLRRTRRAPAAERPRRDDRPRDDRTGERRYPPDVPAEHVSLIPAPGVPPTDFRPTISRR